MAKGMPSSQLHNHAATGQDRRALALLFCIFAFCYGYFYQGGGWNQNSQFDTIRALVERGTTEITEYSQNTGDIGSINGRVYSNKPPGLAFLGAPFYFAAYHLQRALGLDPSSVRQATFNAHLLTFCTSGLPGVLLVLLLYWHSRGKGATVREALWLAAAFGAGSLAFPYAGVMMNHLLNACLLFAAWSLLAMSSLSRLATLLAGLLSGMAIMTESLAAPAVALFFLYVLLTRAADFPLFLFGAGLMTGVLLIHNYACFGSPFINNTSIMTDIFKTKGHLLGVLGWPQPVRLFWLTFHPFRGIFVCCPVLLVSLLSIRWSRPAWPVTLETAIPLGIITYHFLFNMSFNGWTGGWAVGPRYLIPALPFLFSFALTGFRRFQIVAACMAALSAVFMLSVSAVTVMVPAKDDGPPPRFNPVFACLSELAAGRVSISRQGILDFAPTSSNDSKWASYNLGELAGLHGLTSLIPVGVVFLLFVLLAYRLTTCGLPLLGTGGRVP
jgi:hypothetical protein